MSEKSDLFVSCVAFLDSVQQADVLLCRGGFGSDAGKDACSHGVERPFQCGQVDGVKELSRQNHHGMLIDLLATCYKTATCLQIWLLMSADTKLMLTKSVLKYFICCCAKIANWGAIPWKCLSFLEIWRAQIIKYIKKLRIRKSSQGVVFAIISCQRACVGCGQAFSLTATSHAQIPFEQSKMLGSGRRVSYWQVISCVRFMDPSASSWLMHLAIANSVAQLTFKCFEAEAAQKPQLAPSGEHILSDF